MTLTELIEEERGMITLTGTVPEVRSFAYCLEQAISKGTLRKELEDHLDRIEKGKEYIKQFNFSAIHRIYYDPGRLLLGANAHDKKFWFPIIKHSYDEAMQAYRNSNI